MPILVLLVLVGGTVAVAVLLRVPVGPALEVSREWRNVRAMRLVALLLGVAAAWLAAPALDLGRGVMLVPAIIGLALVAGVALSEALVRPARPAGPRTASLTTRSWRDYTPSGLAGVVLALGVAHLGVLLLTTLTASADDLGRAGRQIAHQCGDMGNSRGPYPGAFYSVPLVALLAVITVVAALAIAVVVRRPRGFALEAAGEDQLRRRSIGAVLAALGATIAASNAGICLVAGQALRGMECVAPWMRPTGTVLLVLAVVSVLLFGWCAGRLLVGESRR